jgi:Auxiliary Activity family 9 (formerly GH61)
MKKVDDAVADSAAGDGWFKIWDEGYDETAQKWCTMKLIDANGLLSVQMPQGLVGGHYLVRPELLALHEADKGDPQYYSGCAQIFLESSGELVPSNTVAIPGYVAKNDAPDSYNIWTTPLALPYPIPGPQVATFQSSGGTTQTELTIGLKPAGCLLEVGSNWCGIEVPSYTDEAGCWSSAQNCWDQVQGCYDNAPPTGSTNCKLFEDKCQGIDDQCNAGNFAGPPDAGKALTPVKSTTSPPSPLGSTVVRGRRSLRRRRADLM